jgi:hypothetical protein
MSIDFMVLGGPRSATTWAANWLTTDTTFCLHDPLLEYTVRQLENMTIPGKRIGISCTSAMLYPEWINAHPAKKILVYRGVEEINASLKRLGLVELEKFKHLGRLDAIKGVPMFRYEQLFLPKFARLIAAYLGVPWDAYRHDLLAQMNVQPNWKTLTVGKDAAAQLIERIRIAR